MVLSRADRMRLTGGITLIAALVTMAPAALCAQEAAPSVRIEASRLPFVRNVDERFQSYQIGMSHLTGGETWRAYDPAHDGSPRQATDLASVRESRPQADLGSRKLRTLTAALAPLYIRFGGTTSNSVFFQDDDRPQLQKAPTGFSVVLTRASWKRALDFAKAVDAKVLTGFTSSAGVRDASGAWTPRMAAPWLAYTKAIGGRIYAAELFNEPNAPDANSAPKGIAPADLARDLSTLEAFVRKTAPNLKIAAPGVARLGVPIPSLDHFTAEQYLAATPRVRPDIVSYHFYGALAERCAPANSPVGIGPDKALSEDWLARPDAVFQEHKNLRDRFAPGAPIWLTETGGAACGGMRWQPTFLDTFRYLDTHARLAKQGLDAIFTHALISGSNGVIDEKTFDPNASYWAAVLWRRTMGTKVLDAGANRPGLHIYAHCQRGGRGGVTLLAQNLGAAAVTIEVSGRAGTYALTAPELQSRTVLLNGKPLTLKAGDRLPSMTPIWSKSGQIQLAPFSNSFIVLPNAGNGACRA